MTKDEAIEILEVITDDLRECGCSRTVISKWIKLLKNEFRVTYILNIPQLQILIVQHLPKVIAARDEYVRARDSDPFLTPQLRHMYRILGNKSAPELAKITRQRFVVRRVLSDMKDLIERKTKRDGPCGPAKARRQGSQNPNKRH